MSKFFQKYGIVSLVLLLAACSPSKKSSPEKEDGWAEIQPIEKTVPSVAASPETNTAPVALSAEEIALFKQLSARLEEAEKATRKPGQTLALGEGAIFDYVRRFVRLDGHAKVMDDRGVLEAGVLLVRFSPSNRVEVVECSDGMKVYSGDRLAGATKGTYAVDSGQLQLDGDAWVSDSENRLYGQQIRFWLKGERRLECAPNAILEIRSTPEIKEDGMGMTSSGKTGLVTTVRSDELVYDEKKRLAEFDGHVRVENSTATLNCERVVLHLKGGNELDWLEALSNVVIRASDGREATANRATYKVEEGLFVLEGDPVLRQGKNTMRGDVVRFWTQGDRRMECGPHVRLMMRDTGGAVPGHEQVVSSSKGETRVWADRMVYLEKENRIHLQGHVRVRDPRVDLDCAESFIYLKTGNKIDWIQAVGEVIIQSGGRKALADQASYYADAGRIVLEGNPKLKQGENILTGDRITFWQRSERMVCEPSARILFYPDDKTRERFSRDLKE